MANTTNLDLVKPLGTDHALISQINGNMDKIDAFAGNTNSSLNSLADGLAILANGNTHAAITSGQFVYVRGHGTLADGLYQATSNIAQDGTLSGSNLTADSAGGLNTVYSSLNSNFSRLIQGAIEISDANNATEQGIPYWLGSNASNVPEDWVYVRVVNRDNNGTYISQICYPMNYNGGDKIWFRQKNGSGWGYWRRITTEVQTKKTFYRVVKTYNNLTIGSSGWLKFDDFGTIKNEHSSILTDSWYLASMTIRGWTGGTMPINIGKGSNGSDFYLMGVAQTGLSITVEYFFANPDVVTVPT